MIWAALVLSISGYGWYLAFASNHPFLPLDPVSGLGWLLVLSILPTWLGFRSNRNLLSTQPTGLKIILVNILQTLLYYVSITLFAYRALTMPETATYSAYILTAIWQFLSWLCDAYFAFNADFPGGQNHIRVVEISLVLTISAVFLLTFMAVPPSILIMLVMGWFIAMTMTLAVAGKDSTTTTVVRYDIIFFHGLIPGVVAVILFGLVFSAQFRLLFKAAQGALAYLWHFILYLLELISPPLPETNYTPSPLQMGILEPGRAQGMQEVPTWLVFLIFALAILFFCLALGGLLKLLRTRFGSSTSLPPRKTYRWQRLVVTLRQWLPALCSQWKTAFTKFQKRIQAALRRWLPARTPEQKIMGCYEAFLRLGLCHGCFRRAAETPWEYAERLMNTTRGQLVPANINRLHDIFLEARYSKRQPSWQQAEECEALLQKIAQQLKKR